MAELKSKPPTETVSFASVRRAGKTQGTALASCVSGVYNFRTMAPALKTRLGPYEIVSAIGAGGMGEVYRARDTRLNRDVAIKVLPEALAHDTERMARLRREAQVLASLNHPNIAAIYGFEDSAGAHALVMELVEGPTIAERISGASRTITQTSADLKAAATKPNQGSAIAIDEALPIAKQIAEGLEYAHERGVIHRDLKPSNIKITNNDAVKILDFGLARAIEGDADASSIENSPTLSALATNAGFLLGTAAYMSPEQARGKKADRRADIWAFGVVLYEMLSGKRLFTGETTSDTLAEVLKMEPDWTLLPANTPPRIRELLQRCLKKDPRQRMQSIGDARIALEEAISGVSQYDSATTSGVKSPLQGWRRALPWAVAGLLALTTALALWSRRKAPEKNGAPLRLSIELGAQASLNMNEGASVALSPDGNTLVFVADGADGVRRLYLRPLTQTEAVPIPDTEAAQSPFFSPDGQWIAFFSRGWLKKVSLQGGSATTLCDIQGDRGGSWSDDGTIVFPLTRNSALFRVSADGGTPRPLTKLDRSKNEITHRWPQVLPGAQAVLFTANSTVGAFTEARIMLYSLKDGTRKELVPNAIYARYLPSGHLVYLQEGKLFAAPFNLKREEITGAAVPIIENMAYSVTSAGAQFAFSQTGSLVYAPGKGAVAGLTTVQWMDAAGQLEPLRRSPMNYRQPSFSPDGKRLAMVMNEPNIDIWLYDWGRDIMTRLTFEPGTNEAPVWTPDGQRLAFASDRDGGAENIYWQRADGGSVERLTQGSSQQFPWSWTPDGKTLLFVQVAGENDATVRNADIWMLPIEGDERTGWKPGKPRVLLNSPFIEWAPAVSPDGRWLAYASTESGQFQVYVTPFPRGGAKWQVSSGGQYPTWSPNGKELFYEVSDGNMAQIMVADYSESQGEFRAGKPRLWSAAKFDFEGPSRTFALHPDGKRFAVLREPEESKESKTDKVTLILNFFDELRRRVPTGKN